MCPGMVLLCPPKGYVAYQNPGKFSFFLEAPNAFKMVPKGQRRHALRHHSSGSNYPYW